MFEELKEILLMVAKAGEVSLQMALSLVIAFGIYKLLTLASVLVLIKYTIEKLHNYFITRKVESTKWTIRNSKIYVSDEEKLYRIAQLSHDLYYMREGRTPDSDLASDMFNWQGQYACLAILQEESKRLLNKGKPDESNT